MDKILFEFQLRANVQDVIDVEKHDDFYLYRYLKGMLTEVLKFFLKLMES